MRDLVFTALMFGLLPLAVMRPFVGILLWSWVSFMAPHRELWGFAGSLPWAAMVIGATVLGCVLAREPKRFELNAVSGLALVLAACFTITTLFAQGSSDFVWLRYDRAIKALIGLALTAALLTDRWRVHALVWLMVISIGFYSVKGGIFTIINGGSYRIFGPAHTMIADNNHLAAAMLVALPLMNYLRLQSRHPIVRQVLLVSIVLSVFAVVGSYSRGALLGLIATAAVLWWRTNGKIVSGIVIVICVAGAAAFMPPAWVERMNSIGSYQQDGSAAGRIELWGISWKLALKNPVLGTGFGGPYYQRVVNTVQPGGPARAVHSIWFEILGEHGFPTFFVWFGMTVAGVVYSLRLIRLARDRPDLSWAHDFARMAQVSIVAYLVSGTFLSLSYWDYYWTLLVAIGAVYRLALREIEAPSTAVPATARQAVWAGRGAASRPLAASRAWR